MIELSVKFHKLREREIGRLDTTTSSGILRRTFLGPFRRPGDDVGGNVGYRGDLRNLGDPLGPGEDPDLTRKMSKIRDGNVFATCVLFVLETRIL